MKRVLKWILLVLGVLVLAVVVYLAQFVPKFLHTDRIELGPNAFAILGGGGNTAILTEGKSALVVDTKMWPAAKEVIEALDKMGVKPTVVINTHHHPDHSHGNPIYPIGTKVVASKNALDNLLSREPKFWAESPAKDLLPNDTVTSARDIVFGDETVSVIPLPMAHTNGDVAVLFRKARVVVTGDVVFATYYPRIDRPMGSWKGMAQAAEAILALPADKYLPGHGPLLDRAGVENQRDFDLALIEQVERVVKEGGKIEDAYSKVDLSKFGRSDLGPILSRKDCIRTAWNEATTH